MNSPRIALFVAGTDTGVGKTHVAAALLSALRNAGRDAVVMKPVQTGARTAADLEVCSKLAGWKPADRERRDLCPYRFPYAASPHLAARRHNAVIAMRTLLGAFDRLCRRHDALVVEGAGGLLVPLSARMLQVDLIERMGIPVVLVARPGLGTLNHTLLSVEALRARRRPIAGVGWSMFPRPPDGIARENACYLRSHFAPVPVLELPRLTGSASCVQGGRALLRGLGLH